ncbi:hypothetical protein M1494_02280 [Candidatus Parvarchaeota archaeon]|nr:hypothetical protein [Candidatus Parvarchaeota archaeon]
MESSNLEELLSDNKFQFKQGAFEYLKKHSKAYKIALSGIMAFPEMYSVLLAEKVLHIIPSYEYQFAYVQHATATLPVIYAVAVIGTYLDLELVKAVYLKFGKRIKDYFKNV